MSVRAPDRLRGPVARLVGRGSTPWLLGPAFVAAVAYVDPGNVAANVTAGARYGYLLVWVLVAANLMAVLVQLLSARLGLVTGRGLPDLIGERLGRPGRLAFWAQAEAVAAATDLAEVVGGAIALQLLFDLTLVVGGLVVGLVSIALLEVQNRRGQRPFERVVVGLLAVLAVGFLAGLAVSPVDPGAAARGLVPGLAGPDSVLLAASMLGATVMPHAIYLHAGLARDRHGLLRGAALDRVLRATRWDVGLSLGLAGSVNVGLLLLAAAALPGAPGADTIAGAHAALGAALGPVVATLMAVGLLASGLASTSVGCYAGSAIMAGLLRRRVPLLVRRAATLVPALVVLASGAEPTWVLVLSQVVLSLGIPFALVPLVVLSGRGDLMGEHAVRPVARVLAWLVVAAVSVLNVALVALTLGGRVG